MILNAAQINETIKQLKTALAEQERILAEAEKIVITDLSIAWECQAQQAYADSFITLKNRVLTQINALIALFGTALEQSQNDLYQVDINLAQMTSSQGARIK